MKKIIAILLALTLALSVCGMLVACGDDPTNPPDDPGTPPPAAKTDFELFVECVQNTTAASVVADIEIVNGDVTLTAKSTLNATTNSVEYTVLNKLDIENTENTFTSTETLTAKSGTNTVDIKALAITLENIEVKSLANGVLTATVKNVAGFFGTEVAGVTTAEITMTTANNALTGMTVSYTSANGSAVTMTITIA